MQPQFSSVQLLTQHFNPRIPCGLRRMSASNGFGIRIFQSTHPVRDATEATASRGCLSSEISIQASRAGCDICRLGRCGRAGHFNPRIPCGMRPYVTPFGTYKIIFQSTHPVREATLPPSGLSLTWRFQSTHPVRDATRGSSIPFRLGIYFNPRIPCGMRRSL